MTEGDLEVMARISSKDAERLGRFADEVGIEIEEAASRLLTIGVAIKVTMDLHTKRDDVRLVLRWEHAPAPAEGYVLKVDELHP